MNAKLTIAGIVAGASCLLGAATVSAQAPTPAATSTTAASPTPTKSPTPTPLSVPNAIAFRDTLLSLALGNLDAQASPAFEGAFPIWRQTYPGIGLDGNAIATKDGRVSIYYNRLNSKDLESSENPKLIAFVVGDVNGKCAGAVIYGFPKTDKTMLIDAPTPCTGQGVVAAFKLRFQATATATATPPKPSAPLPPATGQGFATGSGPWPVVQLALLGGVVATFAAAGLTALRVRRH